MKTIEEIRREWLTRLIEQHRSIANLNVALGRAKTDATLSQIKNKAVDSKSGNPRNMGSPLAREIEEKLGLEIGALDHEINERAVEKKTNIPWQAYEAADESIQSVIDFILYKDNSGSHPLWVDSDAKAHADSLELKSRKWHSANKSSENQKKNRA